jgi:acetyl esterase/lipase
MPDFAAPVVPRQVDTEAATVMQIKQHLLLIAWLACCACTPAANDPSNAAQAAAMVRNAAEPTLTQARQGFQTRIVSELERKFPAPTPPAELMSLVRYRSAAGELAAHLTRDPGDGARHPAIVWITGMDCNSIGETWVEGPRADEQSAAAYRRAGIVTMFPSLRGGNDNPGRREGFYGEVDDVLAAAEYLSSLSYVDPQRIYLGGHSTGGTLSMLVAESSRRFRAVFAFGPVDDVRNYGGAFIYHDPSNEQEAVLRAPGRWLPSVQNPLFVFEGTGGNIEDLNLMRERNGNPSIRFFALEGKDHFDLLAPLNEIIAAKILGDTGVNVAIEITPAEVAAAR